MIPQKNIDPEDVRHGSHEAAFRTTAPLSDFMVRLMTEELPFQDSHTRGIIYEELRKHAEAGGGVITSQEELPSRIREIMDL